MNKIAINLKPKAMIPYLWKVSDDNIVFRITAYNNGVIKQLNVAEKTVYVDFMSIYNGDIDILRGGLGKRPIDNIRLAFNTVLGVIRKYKFESVVFKFPLGKVGGQEYILKRVLETLINTRSKGLLSTENIDSEYVFAKVKLKAKDISIEDINDSISKISYIQLVNNTNLTRKEVAISITNTVASQDKEEIKTLEKMKVKELKTPFGTLEEFDLNSVISMSNKYSIINEDFYSVLEKHIMDNVCNASVNMTVFVNVNELNDLYYFDDMLECSLRPIGKTNLAINANVIINENGVFLPKETTLIVKKYIDKNLYEAIIMDKPDEIGLIETYKIEIPKTFVSFRDYQEMI